MPDASPTARWGGMTPAERRIVGWVIALVALGIIGRALLHESALSPSVDERIDGSAGSPASPEL